MKVVRSAAATTAVPPRSAVAYRYRGSWQPADTLTERNALEAAYQGGTRPWVLWEGSSAREPDRDPLQAAIAQMQSSSGHQWS